MRHHIPLFSLVLAAIGCAPLAVSPRVVTTDPVSPPALKAPTEMVEEKPATVFVRLEHTRRTGEVDIDVTIPILSSHEPQLGSALDEINDDLRSVIARSIAAHEKAAVEKAADEQTTEDSATPQPFALHVTCRPALLSNTLVSIACDAWQYTGGAHGMHGTTGHNYFVTAGGVESIELGGILAQPNVGLSTLARFATSDLREQGAMFPALETRQLSNFTFTPDGVVLHFAPSIVSGFADGDFEVVVTYDRLSPLLRKGSSQRAIENAASPHPRLHVVLNFAS